MDTPNNLPNLEKLRHVPVGAIRTLLHRALGDDIHIASMDRDELLDLVKKSPEIKELDVENIYEEYRYGGRASFYIYFFPADAVRKDIPLEAEWNDVLRLVQDGDEESLHVEVCDIETLELGITEIRYKYHTQYPYIHPENEDPDILIELNFGFLWLNLNSGYMVIMSKRERVNAILEGAVSSLFSLMPTPVRFPKGFVNTYFPLESIRRGSWFDPKTQIRHSISGENLFSQVGQEVRGNDEQKDRMGALYEERTENVESKLGITLQKGKIYLTKTISASNLRGWMYNRLHPIIIQLQNQPVSKMIQTSRAPLPELNLSSRGESLFREILSGIFEKQQNPDTQVFLQSSSYDIFKSLKQFFLEPELFFFCEECGELSPVLCANCEGGRIRLRKTGIQCEECGLPLSRNGAEINCLNGHKKNIELSRMQLILRPNSSFQEHVSRFLRTAANVNYNPQEEFFWIDTNELRYVHNTHEIVLLPEQIDEYHSLLETQIPADLRGPLEQLVYSTREKCNVNGGHPRRADCEDCYHNNPGRLCILKFFRSLSRDYMPLPHGAMEFGDVNLYLTIKGKQRAFIGIAKSVITQRFGREKEVGVTDSQGEEIIRQVVIQALKDQRVEVFGIVSPNRLNGEFRATLAMLAKMANKPVIFFGIDELITLANALISNPDHQSLQPLLLQNTN